MEIMRHLRKLVADLQEDAASCERTGQLTGIERYEGEAKGLRRAAQMLDCIIRAFEDKEE